MKSHDPMLPATPSFRLDGKRALITGAGRGIGLACAAALAQAGADVTLLARSFDQVEEGAAAITQAGGSADAAALDVTDVDATAAFVAERAPFDILLNNAGLMAVPESRTADGFEMQFGTNFLGHFALTGLLLPRITDRVVTLSSLAHRLGKIDLADPNWRRRRYQRWLAYGQSKLADLMFAYELEHRFVAAGSPLRSMAAHPGYSATNLQSRTESFQDALMGVGNKLMAQSAEMGARPALCAATMPELWGGAYLGPDGWGEATGNPVPVGSSVASHDRDVQRRLWDAAVELTGVTPAIASGARA